MPGDERDREAEAFVAARACGAGLAMMFSWVLWRIFCFPEKCKVYGGGRWSGKAGLLGKN